MEQHFTVLITAFNTEGLISKCLDSIGGQNYTNFEIIVTDANSTDSTFERCLDFQKDHSNVKLIKNKDRKLQGENVYNMVVESKPRTICVSVDGDDWLKHDNVLNVLNEVYTDDVWMTYGSYEEFPYADVSRFYKEYSEKTIKENSFRETNWMASHLRTWRRELYLKISKEDLMDKDGKFFSMANDRAFQYPMLEMSGRHAVKIPEILYVYNKTNPASEVNSNQAVNDEIVRYIKQSPKYQPLDKLYG